MKKFSIKKLSLVLVLVLLMTAISACGKDSQPKKVDDQVEKNGDNEDVTDEKVDIMVSAAISLTDALEELKEIYEKDENVNIVYNFGASGALMQQIEEGAPVDLFLSAAQKQMDELEEKDLIVKDSRLDFVGNDLVLIVNNNHKDKIKSVDDLLNLEDEKIAMGEPESVPAGKYTQETLTSLNLYDKLLDNMVFAKNVRQVITYVDGENAVAGFCYGSDAIVATDSSIAEVVEGENHEPIVYPAAIVKDSENAEAAQKFLDFITTDEAKDIFEKHGFTKIK